MEQGYGTENAQVEDSDDTDDTDVSDGMFSQLNFR